MNAVEELTLSAVEEMSHVSAIADHEGTTAITLKVGDCEIVLKEGLIEIKAPKTITLSMSATNNQGADESYQI